MTRVEQLEEEIAKLTPEEFKQLRDRVAERDWDAWDARSRPTQPLGSSIG